MKGTTYSSEWEQRFVEVVYERGHERFFERFLLAHDVKNLLIVSPWITSLSNETVQLSRIAEKIKKEEINTCVFMRDPKKEDKNADAVDIFNTCPTLRLYYNNELHAKVYVSRCEPFGFALVGSANLSGFATRSYEIGLMIEGKGKGTDIIEDLVRLGRYDLPGRSGTYRIK